jgi:hypothetical protein
MKVESTSSLKIKNSKPTLKRPTNGKPIVEHRADDEPVITLPSAPQPMTAGDAAKFFAELEKSGEAIVPCIREFTGPLPTDAGVNFLRAMEKVVGFFTIPPSPHTLIIDVPTGLSSSDKERMVLGKFRLPGWSTDEYIETSIRMTGARSMVFYVVANVKNRNLPTLNEILAKAEDFIRNNSIYRGKRVQISFEYQRQGRKYDPGVDQPTFRDSAFRSLKEVALSRINRTSLNTYILPFLTDISLIKSKGISTKRCALLSGSYGSGKTITCDALSSIGQKHGWTTLYCRSIEDLQETLRTAAFYDNCIVVCEDFDTLTSGDSDDDRTSAYNDLINTIDGVDTKNKNLLMLFTTNNVNSIQPAALRSGRIDLYLVIDLPDEDCISELLSIRAAKSNITLTGDEEARRDLCRYLVNEKANNSRISEIFNRAMLANLSRTSLTYADLRVAYDSLLPQVELERMAHRRALTSSHPSLRQFMTLFRMMNGSSGNTPAITPSDISILDDISEALTSSAPLS